MVHPRDRRLTFDRKSHSYLLDEGRPLASVTTIIKRYFPAFDADEAIRKMKKKSTHPLAHLPTNQIKEIWESKGNASREEGNLLHSAIQSHLEGNPVEGFSAELSFVDRVISRHGLGKKYLLEWSVFDEEWGLAGTMDAIFQKQGQYRIVDWKRAKIMTSNKWERAYHPIAHLTNCNLETYSLQLAIYGLILERNYGIELGPSLIVQFHPEEDFREWIPLDRRQEAIDLIQDFCSVVG